jgi:hypothetical protein
MAILLVLELAADIKLINLCSLFLGCDAFCGRECFLGYQYVVPVLVPVVVLILLLVLLGVTS